MHTVLYLEYSKKLWLLLYAFILILTSRLRKFTAIEKYGARCKTIRVTICFQTVHPFFANFILKRERSYGRKKRRCSDRSERGSGGCICVCEYRLLAVQFFTFFRYKPCSTIQPPNDVELDGEELEEFDMLRREHHLVPKDPSQVCVSVSRVQYVVLSDVACFAPVYPDSRQFIDRLVSWCHVHTDQSAR